MTALFNTQGISPYAATNTSNAGSLAINMGDGDFVTTGNNTGTRLLTFQGFPLTDSTRGRIRFYSGANASGTHLSVKYRTQTSATTSTFGSSGGQNIPITYFDAGVSPNEGMNGWILINPSYDTSFQDTRPSFTMFNVTVSDNGFPYLNQISGSITNNEPIMSMLMYMDSGNIAMKLKSYPLAHWVN